MLLHTVCHVNVHCAFLHDVRQSKYKYFLVLMSFLGLDHILATICFAHMNLGCFGVSIDEFDAITYICLLLYQFC